MHSRRGGFCPPQAPRGNLEHYFGDSSENMVDPMQALCMYMHRVHACTCYIHGADVRTLQGRVNPMHADQADPNAHASSRTYVLVE